MTDPQPGQPLRRDPGNTDIDELVAPLEPDDDVFTLIFSSPATVEIADVNGD